MLTHSWQEAFCISAPMRTKLGSKANAVHTQRRDFDHLVAGLKICASAMVSTIDMQPDPLLANARFWAVNQVSNTKQKAIHLAIKL
jgi:hypothetical protein